MALFRSITAVPTSWTPEGTAVAYINKDNHLDLLVANFNDGSISVLLGDGDGGFTATLPIVTGDNPYAVRAADLDGDGDIDLISTNGAGGPGRGGVAVSMNDGNGVFTTSGWLSSAPEPADLQLGDLDADGDLDYAYVDFQDAAPSISVMLNQATPPTPFTLPLTFTPATGSPIALSETSLNLLMADLNDDGALDLAVATGSVDSVKIFLNDGHGKFNAGSTVGAGTVPLGMAAGDVNGDGVQDMLVTDFAGNTVSVLLNDGADIPQFTRSSVAVGNTPFGVKLGDLDGDGDLDAVVTARNDGDVYVLLNDGLGPPPTDRFKSGPVPGILHSRTSTRTAILTSPRRTKARTTCRSCSTRCRTIRSVPPRRPSRARGRAPVAC